MPVWRAMLVAVIYCCIRTWYYMYLIYMHLAPETHPSQSTSSNRTGINRPVLLLIIGYSFVTFGS